jgi:hypothetical protein
LLIGPIDEVFYDSDMLLRSRPRVADLPQLIRKVFKRCMSGAAAKLLKPHWTGEKL